MFSYRNLILLQISSNFIVKFISVFRCAKETTWFVSGTDTVAILKRNLCDSSSQNDFFYGTGCLKVNGLFHFYQYLQGHGCKNPGNPLIMVFSRRFYLKLYFPRG